MTDVNLALQEQLVSKLCHDLANDLGNILLGLDNFSGATSKLRQDQPLIDKISKGLLSSAKAAIAKHAYIRVAYGNPSALDGSSLADLVRMVDDLTGPDQKKLDVSGIDTQTEFTAIDAKIFLNLYILCAMIIPFDGKIKLRTTHPLSFELQGERVTDFIKDEMITPKSVQFHYCKALAAASGFSICVKDDTDFLVFLERI